MEISCRNTRQVKSRSRIDHLELRDNRTDTPRPYRLPASLARDRIDHESPILQAFPYPLQQKKIQASNQILKNQFSCSFIGVE